MIVQFLFACLLYLVKVSIFIISEMPKINLWNTISLAQTGKVKLLDSGQELFGTVVKHGVNDKTVTVRVSSRHFNSKYKKALYSNKSKQVHDQYNYCITGDKVIIANCYKLSSTKAYYVKTIVKPFPRPMTPKGEQPPAPAPLAATENTQNATDRTNQSGKFVDKIV